MPDLGKYAEAVLSAYGVSLALILVLVVATVIRGRRVRAEMEAVEAKRSVASKEMGQ
jgi:heme exporter protein D